MRLAREVVPGGGGPHQQVLLLRGDRLHLGQHFNASGRYILSRDYLNVKVWDVNMESHPVCSFPVHDHLRPRLCSLYENDCIFDKFECRWGGASKGIMTGSYHNFFRIYDFHTRAEVCYEASKNTQQLGHIFQPKTISGTRRARRDGLELDTNNEVALETLDFNRQNLPRELAPRGEHPRDRRHEQLVPLPAGAAGQLGLFRSDVFVYWCQVWRQIERASINVLIFARI